MNHLNALQLRLSNERARLANAKTTQEKAARAVWVAQIEREVAAEAGFAAPSEMSDDELFAELSK
jgi:hypothetical protein